MGASRSAEWSKTAHGALGSWLDDEGATTWLIDYVFDHWKELGEHKTLIELAFQVPQGEPGADEPSAELRQLLKQRQFRRRNGGFICFSLASTLKTLRPDLIRLAGGVLRNVTPGENGWRKKVAEAAKAMRPECESEHLASCAVVVALLAGAAKEPADDDYVPEMVAGDPQTTSERGVADALNDRAREEIARLASVPPVDALWDCLDEFLTATRSLGRLKLEQRREAQMVAAGRETAAAVARAIDEAWERAGTQLEYLRVGRPTVPAAMAPALGRAVGELITALLDRATDYAEARGRQEINF
jgi:hypothetical protein